MDENNIISYRVIQKLYLNSAHPSYLLSLKVKLNNPVAHVPGMKTSDGDITTEASGSSKQSLSIIL